MGGIGSALDGLNPSPAENGSVSQSEPHKRLSQVDTVVLPFLGGFGRYQRRLVALTWIPAFLISFSQFSDHFLLGQPERKCVRPDQNRTSSVREIFDLITTGNEGSNVTACMCSEWRFELQSGLQQNVVTKVRCSDGCPWKRFPPVDGKLPFKGIVHLKMKIPSSNFNNMFSTLRFFEGFCLAAIRLSLYVLRIELCLPAWRFSMTMIASLIIVSGQLLMPGLAALCRDWQILQIVIIAPFVLMLPYVWMFPESLRWLLVTQHYQRAKRQMFRIAHSNSVDTATDSSGILSELETELQQKPKTFCVTQLSGTRNLWKNTVVLCVNSLTGYGIHHCFARSVLEGSASHLHYYALAAIAVASCMVLFPVVAGFGRRGGLLTFMIITALASLLQLGLLNLIGKYSIWHDAAQRDSLNQRFSYAFSIIGMFSSHAVSTLSIFYCAEITPTVIRGGGVGLVLASAGFGMLTAPLMELHNQKGFFLHHVILTCCTLLCIICIPLLPETASQPLPETIAEGEGLLRRPILPGEQHHLLARTEVREYSRVQDTPLHQVVNPGNGSVPSNSTANGVRTS
uniref:Solute carrier family 22 member 23 n=2 Tax=Sinocyclocheilus grahami TaxID=75366 RepID=A0A672NNU0_SINGR